MSKYSAKVIWFTGLSGSGKSTLAIKLKEYLDFNKFKTLHIDGDKFRKKNKDKNIFTKQNILENNNQIINHITKKINNFEYILVSVISPLKKTRIKAKKTFRQKYFEVFVKCSLRELKRRDTKNLYKLADKGKMKNLIGYKSKINYETTSYKKISINTDKMSVKVSLQKIINKI